jgi:hypothetical protein
MEIVNNPTQTPKSFQGKYGFYCVDKSTWIKIKYIRKCFFEALKKAHAWQRYYSKQIQNRKGCAPVLTLQDLVFCKYEISSPWSAYKFLFTQKNHDKDLVVDIRILQIYNICRIPYKEKQTTEQYSMTPVQLNYINNCDMVSYVDHMFDKLINVCSYKLKIS